MTLKIMNFLRDRLRAGTFHLTISLSVAALAALLVFGLWYPSPYRELSRGRELFFWVVLVDVILGPLITLIIFNPGKTRRHLTMDFMVIGFLQLSALSYGLWTVFSARPVHLVFEYQRMAVVHAVDVPPDRLAQALGDLHSLPFTGPTLLSLRPLQTSEFVESTMEALGGLAQAAQPNLWQSYEAARAEILKESHPAAQLKQRFAEKSFSIDQVVTQTGLPIERLRFLPLISRKDFWTVLIDSETTYPVGFIELDSF